MFVSLHLSLSLKSCSQCTFAVRQVVRWDCGWRHTHTHTQSRERSFHRNDAVGWTPQCSFWFVCRRLLLRNNYGDSETVAVFLCACQWGCCCCRERPEPAKREFFRSVKNLSSLSRCLCSVFPCLVFPSFSSCSPPLLACITITKRRLGKCDGIVTTNLFGVDTNVYVFV